jgi:hypothetical protein
VGIPPDLVAQAAHSLDRGAIEKTRTLLGLPIGVGRTVDLGRKLSDAEWEHLVVDLRETFDATGMVKQDGTFRQWTNSNLKVLVEPAPHGQRIRFQTYNGTAAGLMGGGLALLGVCAAMGAGLAAAGRLGEPRPLSGLVFMAIMSLGVFAWGAIRLPGWARRRRRQMEELAERLTLPES